MTEFLQGLSTAGPTLLTALIAAVSGWIVARTNKKGMREDALINQLQEEIARMQTRLDLQEARISALATENFALGVYTAELKQWIVEKKDPPPPQRQPHP